MDVTFMPDLAGTPVTVWCCLRACLGLPAGDYPHSDVSDLGGGHVELPAAEMGNLEELSKVGRLDTAAAAAGGFEVCTPDMLELQC